MAPLAGLLFLISLIAAPGAHTLQRSEDPWVGIWVLDSERSRAIPNPNVKSRRIEIEIVAGGLKHRTINIDRTDQERAREFIMPLDGREVTIDGGQRVAFRRLDALTFDRVTKDNTGMVRNVVRTRISKDGRVLTHTLFEGDPANVRPTDDLIFNRRQ